MISKRQLARGRMPDGQPNPLDVHIGNRLRLRRVYLGITQKDLATLAGISHQQIQQYEIGGNRISDRENRRMARVEVMVAQHLRQNERVMQSLEKTDIPAWNHARYLLASSRYPVYDNSQAVYFPSGERCFARMLEELERAEHYIFLEFFIIDNGT